MQSSGAVVYFALGRVARLTHLWCCFWLYSRARTRTHREKRGEGEWDSNQAAAAAAALSTRVSIPPLGGALLLLHIKMGDLNSDVTFPVFSTATYRMSNISYNVYVMYIFPLRYAAQVCRSFAYFNLLFFSPNICCWHVKGMRWSDLLQEAADMGQRWRYTLDRVASLSQGHKRLTSSTSNGHIHTNYGQVWVFS